MNKRLATFCLTLIAIFSSLALYDMTDAKLFIGTLIVSGCVLVANIFA